MRCDEAIVSLLKTPEKIVIGSRKIEIEIGGSDNRNFANLWLSTAFLKRRTKLVILAENFFWSFFNFEKIVLWFLTNSSSWIYLSEESPPQNSELRFEPRTQRTVVPLPLSYATPHLSLKHTLVSCFGINAWSEVHMKDPWGSCAIP